MAVWVGVPIVHALAVVGDLATRKCHATLDGVSTATAASIARYAAIEGQQLLHRDGAGEFSLGAVHLVVGGGQGGALRGDAQHRVAHLEFNGRSNFKPQRACCALVFPKIGAAEVVAFHICAGRALGHVGAVDAGQGHGLVQVPLGGQQQAGLTHGRRAPVAGLVVTTGGQGKPGQVVGGQVFTQAHGAACRAAGTAHAHVFHTSGADHVGKQAVQLNGAEFGRCRHAVDGAQPRVRAPARARVAAGATATKSGFSQVINDHPRYALSHFCPNP